VRGTEIELKETRCEDVGWIRLTQDRVQCRYPVDPKGFKMEWYFWPVKRLSSSPTGLYSTDVNYYAGGASGKASCNAAVKILWSKLKFKWLDNCSQNLTWHLIGTGVSVLEVSDTYRRTERSARMWTRLKKGTIMRGWGFHSDGYEESRLLGYNAV
jgi:hypothetical protein